MSTASHTAEGLVRGRWFGADRQGRFCAGGKGRACGGFRGGVCSAGRHIARMVLR